MYILSVLMAKDLFLRPNMSCFLWILPTESFGTDFAVNRLSVQKNRVYSYVKMNVG